MIKINAGIFKGRKLTENTFDHVRPTTDKVRQALFTKLQFFVPEKRVLDLFCGTGALGIEALSRGAAEVVFADKNAKSVEMTRKNLKNLNISATVFHRDAISFLSGCTEKFDLILLDPPYKSGLYEKVLEMIFERELLSDDGIIVCEHAKEDKIFCEKFEIFDEKKYGTIMLTYLKHFEK